MLFNKIYGLGGRDLMPLDVDQVIEETTEVAKTGKAKMMKEYIRSETKKNFTAEYAREGCLETYPVSVN